MNNVKRWYLISGIIGAIFFAVAYLVVKIDLVISLIIAVLAYIAGVLVFRKNKRFDENLVVSSNSFQDVMDYGVEYINKIHEFGFKVENKELIANINNICESSKKVLLRVKEKPEKVKYVKKFISYYLPLTIKILEQYDKIEDEKLGSAESKEFMKSVEDLIKKINIACQEQLNKMYEGDFVNINADIKVFESMLKSDGLVDNDMNIQIKKEGGK